MHEAALISEVCRIVRQGAAERGLQRVAAVRLVVGEFANAMPQALELAFRAACGCGESPFDGQTSLEIEKRPAVALCDGCKERFRPPEPWLWECPRCGRISRTLLAGEELLVASFTGE